MTDPRLTIPPPTLLTAAIICQHSDVPGGKAVGDELLAVYRACPTETAKPDEEDDRG